MKEESHMRESLASLATDHWPLATGHYWGKVGNRQTISAQTRECCGFNSHPCYLGMQNDEG